ncbi:MAG: 30S ribosomal protein S17 [Thermodesulfobacteriota bacterium]|nr:30S ribosomal protein S17 [Thermodesulfobacteriota bacterium]
MLKRGNKKTLVGQVTSDRMDKTVVVLVNSLRKHLSYGKFIKKRMKYKGHDEKNECRVGDTVEIIESRPYSREKRWRVLKILKKAYYESK